MTQRPSWAFSMGTIFLRTGREHLLTILGILQTREHYIQALSLREFSSHAQELIGALISDAHRLNDCLRRFSFIPQINPWDEHTRTYFTLPDSLKEDSERNGVMYALKLAERGEISFSETLLLREISQPKELDQGALQNALPSQRTPVFRRIQSQAAKS